MSASPRGFHRLRIAARRDETEDAVSLSFAVPPELADTFRFRPGQYLTLRTELDGEDLRRSYSICSGPEEELRVAIKRVPDGRFSAWAHAAAAPDQVLEVMPPAGRFVLPPALGPRHVLAVAAGSGITPILSMLKAVLAEEPHTRATLLYGSRSTASILFREELEALKDRYMARLSVQHVLSREQTDIPVLNGRLDGAKLAALLPGPPPDLALLCGPASLIDEAGTHLLGRGMAPDAVLSERFTPSGTPSGTLPPRPAPVSRPPEQHAPFATATIVVDGLATPVPMAENESVLDAALRAGLDLPYSCRAGMCSTCRARVTEGAATMAVNYGLEPWELDQDFVLTCQAHPRTPRLTVDYDHV